MPISIDHDRRRDEVAEVAATLVGSQGLDALTVRKVAAAAGFSTTVVTHYFPDKRAMLAHTYRFVANRATERLDEVRARDAADLQGLLDALLPLDDMRTRDWKVWVAFWSAAYGDIAMAAEQRQWVNAARGRLRDVLLNRYGGLNKRTAETQARRLLALLMGVAIQALFDPELWSPAQQRRFMRQAIEEMDRLGF